MRRSQVHCNFLISFHLQYTLLQYKRETRCAAPVSMLRDTVIALGSRQLGSAVETEERNSIICPPLVLILTSAYQKHQFRTHVKFKWSWFFLIFWQKDICSFQVAVLYFWLHQASVCQHFGWSEHFWLKKKMTQITVAANRSNTCVRGFKPHSGHDCTFV
jgi:hypothetical protein